MYHAYHPTDTNYVGRQALFDEVTWPSDGWARINNGLGPSKQAASPLGIAEREEEYNFFDDFNEPTLRFGWQWLQNSIPTYRIANGFLELSPNAAVEKDPIGGIMAYWTTRGNYRATTMIETADLKRGEMAGIAAYGDAENALGAGIQDGKVQVWRREHNQFRVLWTADAPRSGALSSHDGTNRNLLQFRRQFGQGGISGPWALNRTAIICRLGTVGCECAYRRRHQECLRAVRLFENRAYES